MRAKPQNNGGTCHGSKNTISFSDTNQPRELKDNCEKPLSSQK